MASPASAPTGGSVSKRCGGSIWRIQQLCSEDLLDLLGDYAPDSWGESAIEKFATAMNLVHQPASGISQAQLIDYIKKSVDKNKGTEKKKVANRNTRDALAWVKSLKTSGQFQDSLSGPTGDIGTRTIRNSPLSDNYTDERQEEPEEELEAGLYENAVIESDNRAINRDEHDDKSNALSSRVLRKRHRTTASTSFLADQRFPKRHVEEIKALNTTTTPSRTRNLLSDCVRNDVNHYNDDYARD